MEEIGEVPNKQREVPDVVLMGLLNDMVDALRNPKPDGDQRKLLRLAHLKSLAPKLDYYSCSKFRDQGGRSIICCSAAANALLSDSSRELNETLRFKPFQPQLDSTGWARMCSSMAEGLAYADPSGHHLFVCG